MILLGFVRAVLVQSLPRVWQTGHSVPLQLLLTLDCLQPLDRARNVVLGAPGRALRLLLLVVLVRGVRVRLGF